MIYKLRAMNGLRSDRIRNESRMLVSVPYGVDGFIIDDITTWKCR